MRPVFVGNLEYDTRQSDLKRLFRQYGRVDRIDMQSGFAFVHFENGSDAEEAIHRTNNTYFGYERRKLTVEWANGERRKSPGRMPNKTLFIGNIDPIHTKERDVERKFEVYGKVLSVRIRFNYAFVRFETQEDATKALDCTQNTKLLDRVVFVEYAWKKENEREVRYADEPRERSPSRRPRSSSEYERHNSRRSPSYDRYRSRSPVRRARP